MVNKVTVNPLSVRGAGDIVSPKTVSDFGGYNSKITSATESVNGANMTVYTMSNIAGSYLTATAPKNVSYNEDGGTFTVSAVLKELSETVIGSANVECVLTDGSVLSGITNSSGEVNFTIPYYEPGVYNLIVRYDGTSTLGGCATLVKVVVTNAEKLELYVENKILQTGEHDRMIGILTDHDDVGVPGALIEFLAYNSRLFGKYNTVYNRTFENVGPVNKTLPSEYILYTNKYICIGSSLTNGILFNPSTNVIKVMVNGTEVLNETLSSRYLKVTEDTIIFNEDFVFDISTYDFPKSRLYGLYGNAGVVTVYDLTDKFVYNTSYISEVVDGDGVSLSNSDSNTRYVWVNPNSTTGDSYEFFGDISLDFDFISYQGAVTLILVTKDDNTFRKRFTGSNYHVRMEVTDGLVHWFVDGVEDGTGTDFDSDKCYSVRLYFGANANIKFKEFVIGGY